MAANPGRVVSSGCPGKSGSSPQKRCPGNGAEDECGGTREHRQNEDGRGDSLPGRGRAEQRWELASARVGEELPCSRVAGVHGLRKGK